MWELYDAWLEGPSMNSRNHVMFATPSVFLFEAVAGVKPINVRVTSRSNSPWWGSVRFRPLICTDAPRGVHRHVQMSWRIKSRQLPSQKEPPHLSVINC